MELWELNLKEIGILKNYLRIGVLKIKFENGIFKKLNLQIGTLENYLKIEVLKIKFFKKKLEFWRIIRKWKFWKLNLKIIKVWKIKLKNWSFEKLN